VTRTVKAVVPAGIARFQLGDPPKDVDDLLADVLAFDVPDAEHIPAYRKGNWDGVERLYDRGDHSGPVGLLDRATDVLAKHGYDVEVNVEGDRGGDPQSFAWDFDHGLRDYQDRAVGAVLENRGGVVAMPTGSGKTVVALRVIHAIGQRAIVLVHSRELLRQWKDRIRDVLDVEPGVIGAGEWSEGPVTVATLQTLMADAEAGGQRVEKLTENYGLAVFDECHRTAGADDMHEIGLQLDVGWRVGLSATPWRRIEGEEMKIEAAVGGEAVSITAAELTEDGYLAEPRFRYLDPADYGKVPLAQDGEEWSDVYRRCIVLNAARNAAVADAAAGLAREGYTVLVSVDRIAHGALLSSALSEMPPEDALALATDRTEISPNAEAFTRVAREADAGDVGAVFLSGDDSDDRRADVLNGFRNGDPPIVVSTLLREGVDLPEVNAVVLAAGGKSDVEKIQRAGRVLRPAGGDHAVICDVRDRGKYLSEHFHKRQRAFADYYGEHGPEWREPEAKAVYEWLEATDAPLDQLTVYCDPTEDRVVIEPAEYLGDAWDDYMSVMQSTAAVGYDRDRQVNYVEHVDRLPQPLEAGVM